MRSISQNRPNRHQLWKVANLFNLARTKPFYETSIMQPGDTLSQPEYKEDCHRCTSTQRIRWILLTIYFPYPATPYAFKESLHHLMSKDQRLYSLEPEETKILGSLIRSQRLLFRGYFSKISRYKISLIQRQQISLTASFHGAINPFASKFIISILFLSLCHFMTVGESQ
ncbi:hypothetical protein DY000_02041286 [Brassica cretica]|uniref:Uncharacterized protein n=1 Tax=Brassica cretica TaxID=69181 RepID=A0ABQ7B9X5_BRACR|nr:hypothetical protein DY000_02041286 [Brassica cretica]